MTSKFQQWLQTSILEQMEVQPFTIAELSNNLDTNYYSTRKAVLSLVEDGLAMPIGHAVGKNIKYGRGAIQGKNNTIPIISHGNGSSKMHELLELAFQTNKPRVVKAYENIPLNIVQLMKAAERARNEEDVSRTLATVKTRLQQDLAALENTSKIIRQILNNDRNWNPDVIKRYPEDLTYDPEKTQQVYDLYFKKDQ